MLDQLRARMSDYLQRHPVGILTVQLPASDTDRADPGSLGMQALPVPYLNQDLTLRCWVPDWSDLAYVLQKPMPVQLIVSDLADGRQWLCYQGCATPLPAGHVTDLPATLIAAARGQYLVVELQPRRLDLIDQTRGWGARETLEL